MVSVVIGIIVAMLQRLVQLLVDISISGFAIYYFHKQPLRDDCAIFFNYYECKVQWLFFCTLVIKALLITSLLLFIGNRWDL